MKHRSECIKQLQESVSEIHGEKAALAGNGTIDKIDTVKEKMEELLSTLSKVPFMDLNDVKEYGSLLEILLGPILHEYFPFFSEKFKRNVFDSFFAPHDNKRGGVASIILCFMGYSINFKACLLSPTASNQTIDREYVAAELSRLFQTNFCDGSSVTLPLQQLNKAILEVDDHVFLKEFLNHLVSLPDRVCAVFAKEKNVPRIFYPTNYFEWIIGAFVNFIFVKRSAVDRIPALKWKHNISELCSKFIVNGYTKLFIKHFCLQCSKNKHLFVKGANSLLEEDRNIFLASLTNLFTCIDLKILRKFLKNFMQLGLCHSHGGEIVGTECSDYVFYQVLNPIVQENSDILYLLQKEVLFDHGIGQPGARFCMKTLCNSNVKQESSGQHEGASNRSQYALSTFKLLLKVWSDKSFIHDSDYKQHLHVTKLLLYAFEWMKAGDVEAISTLQPLLRGVQDHMEMEVPKKRKLGMLIARKFSKALSMMESLDFGDNLTDEDIAIDSDIERDVVQPESDGDSEILFVDHNQEQNMNEPLTPEDPRPKVLDEEDSDDDSSTSCTSSSSEDSDGLIPYDLPEEKETLMSSKNHPIKTPIYIVDCIKGLSVKDDFNVYHVALQNVEKVIQRNDRALKFYGLQLCNLLLRMDNKYNVETVDSIRDGALLSLLVSVPKLIVQHLTSEFFREDYGLSHRHLILNTLLEGAKILANTEDTERSHKRRTKGNKILSQTTLFDGTVVRKYNSKEPTLGKVLKRFKTTSK